VYPSPRVAPRLVLRPERVQRLIGVAPPRDETTRILRGLGFAVDDSRAALDVEVPSFRRDILAEDDLVEEVTRIWGYDRIPETVGVGRGAAVTRPPTLEVTRSASRALIAAGLSEVITYAFVDPDRLAALGLEAGRPDHARGLIALQNPLSRERSILRPALLPGLLEALAINASRQVADARLFEIARVFAPHEESDRDFPAHEELWVGVALTGLREPRAWHGSRDRSDLFDAKGAVSLVLAGAGIGAFDVEPFAAGPGPFEEGRGASVIIDGRRIGWFGEISARGCQAFGLPGPVFAAEVSLSALVERPRPVPRYQRLPRFPAVMRDLALVVPAQVTAAEVERAIGAMETPWLVRAQLFDVYTGSQVGAGRRSLAWSLTFQAPDRTLTDAEVNDVHARVVAGLTERFAAEVRGV
jgi:phenylalanyl-tRNA synthetase beta chain